MHLSEFGANAATPGAQAAVGNALDYIDANADVMIGWCCLVTIKPTADTKTVRARSKTSFGFCVARNATVQPKASYQVLIKALHW